MNLPVNLWFSKNQKFTALGLKHSNFVELNLFFSGWKSRGSRQAEQEVLRSPRLDPQVRGDHDRQGQERVRLAERSQRPRRRLGQEVRN